MLSSTSEDSGNYVNGLKRGMIVVIKGLGIMAALGFLVSPVTRYPGILWFGASIVVGLLCFAALAYLDDDFIKEPRNKGFWPQPLDWNNSANNHTNEKTTDSHLD